MYSVPKIKHSSVLQMHVLLHFYIMMLSGSQTNTLLVFGDY